MLPTLEESTAFPARWRSDGMDELSSCFSLLIYSLAHETGGMKTSLLNDSKPNYGTYLAWLALLWYLKCRIKNAFLFLPLELHTITQLVGNKQGSVFPHRSHNLLYILIILLLYMPLQFLSHLNMHESTHTYTVLCICTVKAAQNCLLALILAEQMAVFLHHMAIIQKMWGAL